MTTKICAKCGEEKDLSEFVWAITGIKRHFRCRTCRAEDRSGRYEKNKEEELATSMRDSVESVTLPERLSGRT